MRSNGPVDMAARRCLRVAVARMVHWLGPSLRPPICAHSADGWTDELARARAAVSHAQAFLPLPLSPTHALAGSTWPDPACLPACVTVSLSHPALIKPHALGIGVAHPANDRHPISISRHERKRKKERHAPSDTYVIDNQASCLVRDNNLHKHTHTHTRKSIPVLYTTT